MTEQEICKEYREAKNKRKQIGILADENICTRGEIIQILSKNGENIDIGKKTAQQPIEPKGQQAEPVEQKTIPDVVIEALFLRLDVIEKEIQDREKEYREIVDFINKGSS